MKAESTIRRELAKLEAHSGSGASGGDDQAIYGAIQALSWVLGGYAPASAVFREEPT